MRMVLNNLSEKSGIPQVLKYQFSGALITLLTVV